MKKNSLLLIVLLLFAACAVKPTLTPLNMIPIDIDKEGTMGIVFQDYHAPVAVKNRSAFAGHHRDVNENNFLPVPFVEYLRISIIDNLNKSPGLILSDVQDGTNFLLEFNLWHFDVYRVTEAKDYAAKALFGFFGAAMVEEECIAEIKSDVKVIDNSTGEVVCSFQLDIRSEAILNPFEWTWPRDGYADATVSAVNDLVVQLLNGLRSCNFSVVN